MSFKTDGIGLSRMLDVDKIFEKKSATNQEQIKVLEDKIDISSNKKASAIKLQGLINGLRASINKVSSPIFSSFNDRKATVSATTDVGVGTDYVKVTAGKFTSLSDFSVTVNQKAKAAKLTLQAGGGGSFNTDVPGLEGVLILNVAGNPRHIAIDPTHGVQDIVKKINDIFIANNDEFKAKIFDHGDGTSNIEISANKTGAGTITHAYNNLHLFGGDVIDPISPTAATDAGRDAQITVNGITLPAQASNKFIDIPYKGVSIDVLKVNTAAAHNQSISIEQDNSGVADALGQFKDAYNHLALFVAQQSQQSGKIDQFGDPFKEQGSIYAEGAHLYDESILREAKGLLETVINSRPSGDGVNLKFRSIADIGLGLVSTPVTEDNIIVDLLDLKDAQLFSQAMDNNLDDIRNLFMNSGTIKNDPANNGAYLAVTFADKKLDSSILGKDIPISLTFDAAGAVTGMTAMVNGSDVLNSSVANPDGSFDKYYIIDAANKIIKFSGTPFDGLRLSFDPKTAQAGIAENFTLNFTHGVTDLALYTVNNMVHEDRKSGSILSAIEAMDRAVSKDEEEKAKLQESIDSIKKDIEIKFDVISNMELNASLQIEAIQRILTPSN